MSAFANYNIDCCFLLLITQSKSATASGLNAIYVNYFIHDGNTQHGPFTKEQLRSLRLFRHTPVWRNGLAGWIQAGLLAELQDLPFADYQPVQPPPVSRRDNSSRSWDFWDNFDFDFDINLGGCLTFLGILAFIIWIAAPKCSAENKDKVPVPRSEAPIPPHESER